MAHHRPAVAEIVARVLDSGCSPEDACRDAPELLAEVREQLRRVRAVDARLDAVFPADEDALADAAPTLPRVPGHDVLSVLGHGGMGVVYAARHRQLNRTVAVKTILGGSFADAASLKRLLREAEAVAGLSHPNVVQLYEVGEHEGLPYFTMELVDGGSLRERIEQRPLDAREAALLVATLADAIAAAHASGVVHRDLKPANVLLTRDGVPKIADFGLARRIDGESSLTRTGAHVGTPSYMSPEQARGSNAIGPATDVYALGAILYAALTGAPPFRSDAFALTLRQVVEDEPVRPSRLARVPRDLETICLECLEKDPARRYASASALAEDLRRFLRHEPIVARPAGAFERARKWVRRRPAHATIAAGAVLALLALAGAGARMGSVRAATGRAVDADLLEVDRAAAAASWPAARTALERARARLADGGSAELTARVDECARELDLVAVLDEIRARRADVGYHARERGDNSAVAAEYQRAFAGHGLDDVAGRPRESAERIAGSRIRAVLVSALDTWAIGVTGDDARRDGLLEAARLADPDPTGWRDRVRDAASWGSPQVLAELMRTAPESGASVALLLALAEHVVVAGGDAAPFLERIQRRFPDDFWANFTLGMRLAENDDASAIRYFQGAVALRPDDAMACGTLGVAMASSGRIEEALVMLRKSKSGPSGLKNRIVLAGYLVGLGRFEECIAESREILALEPRSYDAHLRLAYALHGTGSFDEASAAYRSAIAIDSRAPAHESLANVLRDMGRHDEAIASLREAVRLDPDRGSARRGLVDALLSRGLVREAHEEARAFLDSRRAGDPARQTAESIVQRCEMLFEIETHLARVLEGEIAPLSGAQCLVYAEYFRGRDDHARATRYFAEAFASGARFLHSGDGRSLDAVCSAAIAGAVAADGDALDAERAGARALALEWFRTELRALEKRLSSGTPQAATDVRWCLMRLSTNAALAGVRDPERLARLPAAERVGWRTLWDVADALAAQAKSVR